MTGPAERHRQYAARFSARVAGVAAGDWDRPAPVAGWTARDVVRHLVDWPWGFLEMGSDVVRPGLPSVEDDPVAAWQGHAAAIQGLLDQPAGRVHAHEHTGENPIEVAIDRFYTTDVFLHTWDLARATGQDDTLGERECAELLAGMEPLDQMLRESGQYGPRVVVPEDASAQDRLVGFIGRDPGWRAP